MALTGRLTSQQYQVSSIPSKDTIRVLNEPYPQLRHNIKMASVMGGTMYREVNILLYSP